MVKFIIMGNNKFTEDQIKEAARVSKSLAEMCRQLGLIPAGGNYASMKRRITRYNVDVSHFTGSAWNKDNFKDEPNRKITIKRMLIRERGHQCEKCQNTTWLELPITLELEHIDGNNANNEYTNLLLLCPNCHAQTKTWRRAKSSFSVEVNPKLTCPLCGEPKQYRSLNCKDCFQSGKSDRNKFVVYVDGETKPRNGHSSKNECACGEVIARKAKQCHKCKNVAQYSTDWPSVDELITRLRDKKESWMSVGRSLGVSDTSVRGYLRRKNINPKTFLPLDAES